MTPSQILQLHGPMQATASVDGDVCEYFRGLGFCVTWDHTRDHSHYYYEIMDGDSLLVQIDFAAPLSEIITDLPRLARGEPGSASGSASWEVRGSLDGLQRVADRMMVGSVP